PETPPHTPARASLPQTGSRGMNYRSVPTMCECVQRTHAYVCVCVCVCVCVSVRLWWRCVQVVQLFSVSQEGGGEMRDNAPIKDSKTLYHTQECTGPAPHFTAQR